MKRLSGNIPEEITIIAKPETEECWTFDDFETVDGFETQTFKVRPAFVSDANNKKTLETGRHWASSQHKEWKNGRWVLPSPDPEVTETTTKNQPFKNLKVINVEKRLEGGRAWKVITEEGFYFDLREDVLLDVIKTVGIKKGGTLNGEYIWAKVGSQMKIVRVGSDLYKAIVSAGKRREQKTISPSQWKVGTVYGSRNGDSAIFLGWVDTVQVDCEAIPGSGGFDYTTRTQKEWEYTYSRTTLNKRALFFKIDARNAGREQELLDSFIESYSYWWCLSLQKSATFVETLGTVKLPDDPVQAMRNAARPTSYRNRQQKLIYPAHSSCGSNSAFLNMVPTGQTITEHEVFKNV